VTSFAKLVINAGKSDGMYPNNLIELVNAYSPARRIRIGDIAIDRNETIFEVDSEYAGYMVKALGDAEFNGKSIFAGFVKGEANVTVNERRFFKSKGKPGKDRDFKKRGSDSGHERGEWKKKKKKI